MIIYDDLMWNHTFEVSRKKFLLSLSPHTLCTHRGSKATWFPAKAKLVLLLRSYGWSNEIMLPEEEADHSFWPRRGEPAPPPPAPPPGSPPPSLASPAIKIQWKYRCFPIRVFSNLQPHQLWLIISFWLGLPNQPFITAQMRVKLFLVVGFTGCIHALCSQTYHCPAGVSFCTFHFIILF